MMIPIEAGVPLRDRLPQKPGAPEPRKIPPALVDAVRAEMTVLVQGDIDDPQVLARIAEVAQRARDLFAVVRGQPATSAQAMSMTSSGGTSVVYGSSVGYGGFGVPEQFGARAIRELVGLLPEVLQAQKKESPAEIAEAMRIAKAEGDEELRMALRDKLMGKARNPDGVVEAKVLAAGKHEAHEAHDEAHDVTHARAHEAEGEGPEGKEAAE